ncbi:MAG TPA: PQQ-binding-like beta-propeller repeat protein [Ktedonobacteraceae bacterium]|nr:PQQ-binding-like beta-propeller repeat protein [Ktedonobacteraceae bacterium]
MSANTIKDLKDALDLGLGVVTRVTDYQTKDWVTNVFASDIDNDGYSEIVACSRDGRIYVLTTKGTNFRLRWKRIIGTKAWVGAAASGKLPIPGYEDTASIIVGTRDGKVYVLDKDGKTVSKDRQAFDFDPANEWAIERKQEQAACWYDTGYAIRQISIDSRWPAQIIIGSEDRSVYGLDALTGVPLWTFQTNGWVRSASMCDVDGDGQAEVLVGSTDHSLYLLDQQGRLLDQYSMAHPIYTILAEDVDNDGCIELLVTTEGKDLTALVYHKQQGDAHGCFEQKWRKLFDNRILSFCVTDIDGDKQAEIIAASEDKHIYILDAEGNTIWRHNHKCRIFSIYPYDIDGNGLPELLIGSDDNRVRAMRVRLNRGVEKKVRRYYRQLGEPAPQEITELNAEQRALLQDILRTPERELVTLQQGQALLVAGEYGQALTTLLQLELQKVESLWRKDTIGNIRSINFRHIASEQKREIIVGTAGETIHAFQPNGRRLWSTAVSDHIVDVQTGFIDHHKQEEIVIGSADHRVHILSGGQKPKLLDMPVENMRMSSICITTSNRHSHAEIIVGSEDKKLSIYSGDLLTPVATIATEEDVRIVRAHPSTEDHGPEIVTASLGKEVYAYTRHGQFLWRHETRDRVKEIYLKDINNDGRIEVLIGSEDRNVHVLDSAGHLLWRYYLPHSVLAIDTVDRDGRTEIFVGCADGYLYVFNKDGDLLWTYQAKDRIRALSVDDIDGDGNIEIAIGSEDELELLRLVNQRQLAPLVTQCWSALCQQFSPDQALENLLNTSNPLLQTFALNKLAERSDNFSIDFATLERLAKEGTVEVCKTLVRTALILYPTYPTWVRNVLDVVWTASTEGKQAVRNAFIEHIQTLMQHDQELSFFYLKRASESTDRFARRMVVRKLYQLIDAPVDRPVDMHREIFRLLLTAAQGREPVWMGQTASQGEASEWVRQEAGRTLAHFLNRHHGSIIIYMHLFIVKDIHPEILLHIAEATTTPVVKHFINAVVPMLRPDLCEENILERVHQVMRALEAASTLIYGKDLRLIYTELARLFTIETIAEIADYECALKTSYFDPNNKFAQIILEVFEKLSIVSRPLKMYVRREAIHDRLTSLLETIEALDRMPAYVEQKYSAVLLGEPITRLPDRQALLLLLEKWRRLVQAQLRELRGKAELKVELLTKDVRYDEQIGIWLTVRNDGRSSATAVKITLLNSTDFTTVGNTSNDTEIILPQEEITIEIILRPRCTALDLTFEIAYDNADNSTTIEKLVTHLELRESSQAFRRIPNLYSTGTPTHDSRLFYGRERDMTFLQDNLTRDAKSVVVLYGQRRSGKTTLLVQLINTSTLGECIPVLIDMQRASYHMTISNFLHRVAYYISQAMKRKNVITHQPELANFLVDPTYTFDMFLDEIEELLVGRKLILLVDEFEVLEEQVNKGNLQSEIFDYLRDIVQHRPNINFLFSGTHKITEYTRWYRSVFFNIAIHYRLSRLSLEGAEDLICKPVEGFLEYEPLTVTKIHQLTADQPYLIHLMCRAIVDYCNTRRKTYVTINDVNTVLYQVMQTGRYHFGWLWDHIKQEERVALAVVAEGGKEEGRWLTFNELETIYQRYNIVTRREYILDALKTLIEADIIEHTQGDTWKTTLDNSRFRIPVGLTRSWLLKEHPLELVRKEMRD